MVDINVQNIVDEIRADIEKNGFDKKILTFKEVEEMGRLFSTNFDMRELDSHVSEAGRLYHVEEYPVLWQGSLKAKISSVIKKVLRQFMKFYMVPIVEQQNKFNAATTRSLNQIDAYIALHEQDENSNQAQELTNEINELKAAYAQVVQSNFEKDQQLQRLEEKVVQLTNKIDKLIQAD